MMIFAAILSLLLSPPAGNRLLPMRSQPAEAIPMPESSQVPETPWTLTRVHMGALRASAIGPHQWLVIAQRQAKESHAGIVGLLMHEDRSLPLEIVARTGVPLELRRETEEGQIFDAAILSDGKTLAASAGLPAKGGGNGIIVWQLEKTMQPQVVRTIHLRGCIGGLVAGPQNTIIALSWDRQRADSHGAVPLVTIFDVGGRVVGEALPMVPADEISACGNVDLSRIERVGTDRIAVYDGISQSATVLRIDATKLEQARPPAGNWIEPAFGAQAVVAIIETSADVSALPEGRKTSAALVKAFHVDAAGNAWLVRSFQDGSRNVVSRYAGDTVQTWEAPGAWGAVFWSGETLTAITARPSGDLERPLVAEWQRMAFEH